MRHGVFALGVRILQASTPTAKGPRGAGPERSRGPFLSFEDFVLVGQTRLYDSLDLASGLTFCSTLTSFDPY